ncbi:hypothetical protein AAFF_G00069820 [Aldrovandia affinis]|uniref:Uncharacterized protein n=1 Tax=Aldrovandia affinis TaxID=143900 RepID=A0AAD7R2A9_9TELE|nr:hypothetical protein AAFF_G00069820 [Aldrovandia affinis]
MGLCKGRIEVDCHPVRLLSKGIRGLHLVGKRCTTPRRTVRLFVATFGESLYAGRPIGFSELEQDLPGFGLLRRFVNAYDHGSPTRLEGRFSKLTVRLDLITERHNSRTHPCGGNAFLTSSRLPSTSRDPEREQSSKPSSQAFASQMQHPRTSPRLAFSASIRSMTCAFVLPWVRRSFRPATFWSMAASICSRTPSWYSSGVKASLAICSTSCTALELRFIDGLLTEVHLIERPDFLAVPELLHQDPVLKRPQENQIVLPRRIPGKGCPASRFHRLDRSAFCTFVGAEVVRSRQNSGRT